MKAVLSGDPEIDALVPDYPRLIPELTWFGLDRSRLLAVGTFSGAIVPRTIGQVDLVEFFSEVDGTRSVETLLRGADGTRSEHRRVALLMLFSRGLVEAGVAPMRADYSDADAAPFLARIMDQTRVWNDRNMARRQLTRPMSLINAPKKVAELLARSGIQIASDRTALAEVDMAVFFVDETTDYSTISACRTAGIPALLVSSTDDTLTVGPFLLGRATTTLDACAEIHAAASPVSNMSGLWPALVSNIVFLLHSRTAPMNLLNQYIRYDAGDTGIKSRYAQVPRGGSSLALRAMGNLERERLERQTQLASLPARYSGYKAYEAHYSRRFIAAARQHPETADATAQSLSQSTLPEALQRVLAETFGYRALPNGELKRNCPTGGDLGSPEVILAEYNVEQTKISLYRYVSSTGRVDQISETTWEAPSSAQSRYVIVALGNKGKVKYKYQWLGDNVVQLDAGVAAGYFSNACRALLGRYPTIDLGVTLTPVVDEWVAHRADTYIKTWQCEITKSSLKKTGVPGEYRFRRFVRVSRRRRAIRQLGPGRLSIDSVVTYLEKAQPNRGFYNVQGVVNFLKPVVFVNDEGDRTAYILRINGQQIIADPAASMVDNGELICQHSLSGAPVKIFFLANLPGLLAEFGADGHDRALKYIGAWVGCLWLAIEADGLNGCPAGAVAESDVVGQISTDDAEQLFNLFCFNMGKRVSS